MILGFVLGWAAATWWWPWVLSFYEPKPLPKTVRELNEEMRPHIEATYAQWMRDGGP